MPNNSDKAELKSDQIALADALTVPEVVARVRFVQSVMREVMRPKVHFGTIPGCGDRVALLQPGAEVLALTFQLAAAYVISTRDLGQEHREFTAVCRLTHQGNGRSIAEAARVCSTLEGKYRWRAEKIKLLPGGYWELADRDAAAARELLGGGTFERRKLNGKWWVVQLVEQGNPADYFNTCAAIAQKRAFVAAIRTATASSDVFGEGEEDADDPRTQLPKDPITQGTEVGLTSPMEHLRGLLAAVPVPETELLEWARQPRRRLVPENIQTLEELSLSAPMRVPALIGQFGKFLEDRRKVA
jgi:hypothetical protein